MNEWLPRLFSHARSFVGLYRILKIRNHEPQLLVISSKLGLVNWFFCFLLISNGQKGQKNRLSDLEDQEPIHL